MAKKLQADEWLFAATVGLALFGVVAVYSSSAMVAVEQHGNEYHYVARQAVWTVIGFAALCAGMWVDYRRLRDWRIVYGLLALAAVLLAAVSAFPPINGAQRWIRFGGFSLQPSELSKLALAIFLARFLERRAGEEAALWLTFVPCVAVTGFFAMLVVIEPDLGTALMLAVLCLVMCFAAGVRLLHLAVAVGPVLVGTFGLLVLVPWRMRRLIAFLDPWKDTRGAGYQVVQALIAVGSGGTSGVGFAEGKQKMFFLPFAHSDFIFAVIGEELGLIGALTVVAAFGVFLWRGVRASLLAPDRFGMLLALGIVTMIVAQALFNISVVLALLPTKGIPLPFISYGGSSLVLTLFAAGVLLNISQHGGASGLSAGGDGRRRVQPELRARQSVGPGFAPGRAVAHLFRRLATPSTPSGTLDRLEMRS